jgi:hypothetical protein
MAAQRKPFVIAAPTLADMLERLAGFLRKQGDEEVYQIAYNANSSSVMPPSPALVFTFDQKTHKAKTVKITNTKTVVKDWNKELGIA